MIQCPLPNGKSAPIHILDNRLSPSGELPVPFSFEGIDLFDKFLDALAQMAAEGVGEAVTQLSNILLNRFGEPSYMVKRQVSPRILEQIRDLRDSTELGISQFLKQMTTGQLYISLWKEAELVLLGQMLPKKRDCPRHAGRIAQQPHCDRSCERFRKSFPDSARATLEVSPRRRQRSKPKPDRH